MTIDDVADSGGVDSPARCDIEVIEGRSVQVGAFEVSRVLPRRPLYHWYEYGPLPFPFTVSAAVEPRFTRCDCG